MLQIWEKLVKISKYLVLSRARKNISFWLVERSATCYMSYYTPNIKLYKSLKMVEEKQSEKYFLKIFWNNKNISNKTPIN